MERLYFKFGTQPNQTKPNRTDGRRAFSTLPSTTHRNITFRDCQQNATLTDSTWQFMWSIVFVSVWWYVKLSAIKFMKQHSQTIVGLRDMRHATPRGERTLGEIVGHEIIDPLPKLKAWNDFYYSCAVFGHEFGHTLVARGSEGLETKIERKWLYRLRASIFRQTTTRPTATDRKKRRKLEWNVEHVGNENPWHLYVFEM